MRKELRMRQCKKDIAVFHIICEPHTPLLRQISWFLHHARMARLAGASNSFQGSPCSIQST